MTEPVAESSSWVALKSVVSSISFFRVRSLHQMMQKMISRLYKTILCFTIRGKILQTLWVQSYPTYWCLYKCNVNMLSTIIINCRDPVALHKIMPNCYILHGDCTFHLKLSCFLPFLEWQPHLDSIECSRSGITKSKIPWSSPILGPHHGTFVSDSTWRTGNWLVTSSRLWPSKVSSTLTLK